MNLVNSQKWHLPSSARSGRSVTGIILHWTASSNLRGTLSFMSSVRKGSYNFLIDLDGTVHSAVPKERAAWHTGRDGLRKNHCPDGWGIANDVSIGIAFVCLGDGKQKITHSQITAAHELVALLIERVPTLKWITTHRDCCPKARPVEFLPSLAGWDWSSSGWSGLTVSPRPKGI